MSLRPDSELSKTRQPDMKTYLVTFSPTGTSRKVGEAVARGISETYELIDLTRPRPAEKEISADSVVIVSLPVYGGHAARPALERMKNIRARSGAKGVALVVYGNRDYENALTELGAAMRGAGFAVVAGGAFVGEHSYSCARYPIASGRPDRSDLGQALRFGRAISEKLATGKVAEVELERIERPADPPEATRRFKSGAAKILAASQAPRTPTADESRCIRCGRCTAVCPTEAIAGGDECHTDADRCIRCCACVKACPVRARSYDSPFAPLLFLNFSARKPNRTLL